MLASGVFFLLVVGLFVNSLLGSLITNLEDSLIEEIERETNLHIEHDALSVGFFDTLVLKGVQVRHPEAGREAPLARIARAELSLRPLSLLLGKKDILESISAIRLDKAEVNFYSDTSLVAVLAEALASDEDTPSPPPLLNCRTATRQARRLCPFPQASPFSVRFAAPVFVLENPAFGQVSARVYPVLDRTFAPY